MSQIISAKTYVLLAAAAFFVACGEPDAEGVEEPLLDDVGTSVEALRGDHGHDGNDCDHGSHHRRDLVRHLRVEPRAINPGEVTTLTARVRPRRQLPLVMFFTVRNGDGEEVFEQFFLVTQPGAQELTAAFLAPAGLAPGRYFATVRVENEEGRVLDRTHPRQLIIRAPCATRDHSGR